MSPRYDLSKEFQRQTISAFGGTFLTGRTFYEIRLSKAALVVERTMVKRGRDVDERSVLVETLKAVWSDSTEHKLLIGYVLAESSTLEILWFGDLALPFYPEVPPNAGEIPSIRTRISDEVVKTLSEGLVQSRSLRGLGLS
ncbi:hypothetical protein R1sor_021754 [Riccia sorocarpa]|uniref:Uncharacterized protein n=1 Tax=Riccia sorocarpa TaxID=122646 RepID=A0ABD3GHZ2_9MARC